MNITTATALRWRDIILGLLASNPKDERALATLSELDAILARA